MRPQTRTKESFPKNTSSIIHCITYDYYGQRIALSTENSYIHIYDARNMSTDSSGSATKWEKTYEWKAHTGCVWKLAWVHPEYGQVLASCSEDKSVIIWEEPSSVGGSGSSRNLRNRYNLSVDSASGVNGGMGISVQQEGSSSLSTEQQGTGRISSSSSGSSSSVNRPWVEKAKLVDSTSAVLDIQFAPKHLGLLLATCSSTGHIRIYEAAEVMNLSSWAMQHDFIVNAKKATCLAWNQSPFDEPMMAVGCGDGVVRIYFYNDNVRKWLLLNELVGHKGTVHSVAWAPSLGRNFHLIASGSKDGTVRVWQLHPPTRRTSGDHGAGNGVGSGGGSNGTGGSLHDGGSSGTMTPEVSSAQFAVQPVAVITDHKQEVWKVDWNVTGTILFSTGDDQTVRSFKMTHDSEGILFTPACVDTKME